MAGFWSAFGVSSAPGYPVRDPMRMVYPGERKHQPPERPYDMGIVRSPSSEVRPAPGAPRSVVVEPHPAVRAVLEHLLLREGYAVEVCDEGREAAPGPVLLLVGAEDGSGLYVFQTRDAAGALARLSGGSEAPEGPWLKEFGIHAFLPKPFGVADVLRVVWAVGGFDGRKKGPRGAEAGPSRDGIST